MLHLTAVECQQMLEGKTWDEVAALINAYAEKEAPKTEPAYVGLGSNNGSEGRPRRRNL